MAALKERALDELGPLDVQLMGWRGIEGRDVMVEVRQNGDSSLYELVTPDMASRIVQSHLEEHRPVQRWAVGKDFEAYYEGQTVRISELLGKIDPLSLEDYQDYDGYKSLLSFYSQGFDSFLQKVVACRFLRVLPNPEPSLRHRLVYLPGGEATAPPGSQRRAPLSFSHRRFAAPGGLSPSGLGGHYPGCQDPARPRWRWSTCRPTPRWPRSGCKPPGPG